MSEHSEEQGLRVHHLVNLGGLIAIAGARPRAARFSLGRVGQRGARTRSADRRTADAGGLARAAKTRRAGDGQASVEVLAPFQRPPCVDAHQRSNAAPDHGAGRDSGGGSESLITLLTTLLKEQADGVAAVETARG